MLHFKQERALWGWGSQNEEHSMWDLIQPEVRNEAVESPGLKGPFMPEDFYIYHEGNGEPLTIHEERSDGVTLTFLVQSLGWVSPEVLEQPDEGEDEVKSSLGRSIIQEMTGFQGKGRREHEATFPQVFQPQTTD